MSLDSPWLFCLLIVVALALTHLPYFKAIDPVVGTDARHAGVDGLRGFLALGVFDIHLVVTREFIASDVWTAPDSRFHTLLGAIGVSMFFMITGFLFWGKLLRARGRPRWAELYLGRLFRIGPMYLFVVFVMLAIVAVRTGMALREPAGSVAWSVVQWLALGWLNGQPDVNGYRAVHLLAGVTWTIYWEWLFYASLIAIAPFARSRRHLWIVAAALVVAVAGKLFLKSEAMGFAALFLYGMATASLLHAGIGPRVSDRVGSALSLAALVAVFGTSGGGYGSLVGLLLAPVFYLICSGTTLFGLLTTTSARRLGAISYSLYLMQGLALALVFSIPPLRAAAIETTATFWFIGTLCMALLILASTLTYRWIELPGIEWGQRLGRRLRATRLHAIAHAPDQGAVQARAAPGVASARAPP